MIDATARRGKRSTALALFCGLFAACAGEPRPRVEAPPPAPTVVSSANTAAPLSPIELSQRALAEASTTKDPHDRCQLLQEATILDPSSIDAQLARAESRCAFASELLPNARAAFSARKDQKSAEVLAAVAERAASRADLKDAAALLATFDPSSKLAAARIYAVDDPSRAADLFEEVAAAREARGATLDALDAKLDAAMARADAGKPSGLAQLLDPAAAASKSYGAAWIAPKVLEALAAARLAGENTSALAAHGSKLGLFAGALDAFAIERALATGADLPHLHRRVRDPAVRALLVANAKDCATASAHAHAHSRLHAEGLVLERDVKRAWMRACPNGEVKGKPTLIEPRLSPELADLVEVSRVERLHARARLDKLNQFDPAVRYALFLVSPESKPALAEPSLLFVYLQTAKKSLRGILATFVKDEYRSTIEATIPRALAGEFLRVLAVADSEDNVWNEIASEALTACAIGATGLCHKDLELATNRLRTSNPALLASRGPQLSNDDLSPRVRLDLIVALVDQKKLPAAAKLRSGNGPEASLADALIAATNGNCTVAKLAMTKAATLQAMYSDVFARIAKSCPA